MFGSRRKIKELEKQRDELLARCESLTKKSFLISIERNQRVNTFGFLRDGQIIKIETMGLISDNLGEWKDKLLR